MKESLPRVRQNFASPALSRWKDSPLDRDLVPDYPGITESETLQRLGPAVSHRSQAHSTAGRGLLEKISHGAEGFCPTGGGTGVFGNHDSGNSLRCASGPEADLPSKQAKAAFEPRVCAVTWNQPTAGFAILPVRAQGLEASQGATDFGEYFLYFSFFLVVSALMLAALFFKLGIEQRLREIGLLQAVGFPLRKIRRLFLIEG